MSSLVSMTESLPDHDTRPVEGPATARVRAGLLADSTDQRWQRRLLPVMSPNAMSGFQFPLVATQWSCGSPPV